MTEKSARKPDGGFVQVDGEEYYRIRGVDSMPPFLMNIPSAGDLWMFVASNGGLTAGRVDPEGSLFPYETVDKLYRSSSHTGPVTMLRVERRGERVLWEPLAARPRQRSDLERSLYKNVTGNRVMFEEIDRDLGLSFRYGWSACDEFGHVRTAELENLGDGPAAVEILDGLRNILPFGVPLALYQQSSSLVDAYKRADLDGDSRIAVYSLTSRIIDRAEAAEELRANVAWSRGLEGAEVFLSADAVRAFEQGTPPAGGRTLTGRPGSYLLLSRLELDAGAAARWHIAADAGLDHFRLAELRARLLEGDDIESEIDRRLAGAREAVDRIVGSADGIQATGHAGASVHHFADALYNCMRGGIFDSNYDIPASDLADFIGTWNRDAAERHRPLLEGLPESITERELSEEAEKTGDADLIRLCLEYMPLYFGRRHGDPSRPWNRFSIRVSGPEGRRILRYEGNWRDIFQNWEALALSFPRFIPSMIAKFVNGSTVDGFNPYRITREGIDWEVEDPDDPWSYIGYWGDHQIVYLLKFLEALPRYYPGELEEMLGKDVFAYADVPYRIKPYGDIVRDPHSTIIFDTDAAERTEKRVSALGSDGRLVHDPAGGVYHVNLFEKLLVPVLSKLSNLVPEGGIWMNTQRPEWNDANNALVGYGVSMVTLCYLRRHLIRLSRLFAGAGKKSYPVSNEVAGWLEDIRRVLDEKRPLMERPGGPGDEGRREIMDGLGEAFSRYREKVYSSGFSGRRDLAVSDALGLFETALEYADRSIRANRRGDGLYHSYNLLDLSPDGRRASLGRLYEMLEGQVAVLGSGLLDPGEAADLVTRLFESALYSGDRKSFMLYPEKDLPGFLERNALPERDVMTVPLLAGLLAEGDRSIIGRDASGVLRFNADFANAADLSAALDELARRHEWEEAVDRDRGKVLGIFEKVFEHRTFTGRSGRMYKYEGIGCIYWHMVAKLLLAVQERALEALEDGGGEAAERLVDRYYGVRAGLGFEKTAAEFGAFPTDPYSHTPPQGGARQPGMTGQVKEEIITRFGELGVAVEGGRVRFDPVILEEKELLREPGAFEYFDLGGEARSLELGAGQLAFTLCQVPVVYRLAEGGPRLSIEYADGTKGDIEGKALDAASSRSLFDREGRIVRIEVELPPGAPGGGGVST